MIAEDVTFAGADFSPFTDPATGKYITSAIDAATGQAISNPSGGTIRTQLNGAILSDSDFTGVNFTLVRAENIRLDYATLVKANLTQADLDGAVIDKADVSGADFSKASLVGVDLKDAIGNSFTDSTGKTFITKFTEADLTRAILVGGSFINGDFSGAILGGAALDKGNFTGANFTGAIVTDTTTAVDAIGLQVGGAGNDTSNGTTGNDNLFGNSGNDTLNGLGGNDYLDGGTGNDRMVGSTGNDTYVVNSASDTVVENANEGTDTVRSSLAYTLGNNLENLTLIGTSNINGTGNSLGNVITGNNGNNTINGGDGNDTINGGSGSDILVGGAGNDSFSFNSAKEGIDTIQGFVVNQDKIVVSASGFGGGLTPTNSLPASRFATNRATTADQRFIYESSTGKLFFDPDGNGSLAQSHFATLSANLALTHASFVVVS